MLLLPFNAQAELHLLVPSNLLQQECARSAPTNTVEALCARAHFLRVFPGSLINPPNRQKLHVGHSIEIFQQKLHFAPAVMACPRAWVLNSVAKVVCCVQNLRAALMKPKSLQTSVSKRGTRAESFLVSLLVL